MQPPENMTLNSGDTAKFLCTVDMTCMVSYVEWYKHNDNGEWNENNDYGNTVKLTLITNSNCFYFSCLQNSKRDGEKM